MRSRASDPRIWTMLWTGLVLLAGCGLAGCSDDDDNPVNPGTPATQLTGVFTGANDGGLMTLTIPLATEDLAPARPARPARPAGSALAHDVQALATLALDSGGATINLTGTYSEETDSLHLNGQGYTVEGRYDPAEPAPGVTGAFEGPLGPGFFDCAVGGSSSVQAFCGEHTRNQLIYERMHAGLVDFSDLFGFIVIDDEPIHFEGTATSKGGSVWSVGATKALGAGAVLLISGTLSTGIETMWGEWVIEVNGVPDDSGTWSLAPCLPGTTGPN